MRLLFAARAIGGVAGGVERMVIALANEMSARGHEAGLFTWDRRQAEAFYPIAPSVVWHRLDFGDANRKAGPLMRVRRAIAVRATVRRFRPDIIIAFQGGAFRALRLYCTGMTIPMIATERNAPTLYDYTAAGEKGRLRAFKSLRMAHSLVIQCDAYLTMYPSYLQEKLIAIPNPVDPAAGEAAPDVPDLEGRFRLLAVGRLAYQKNFGSLINAFSRLALDFPRWDLVIVGEGEDRDKLERLAHETNLGSRISLPGATKDTNAYYASSHLFCLPSLWEGFPNALAEALAYGLPAVGFSDSAGVNVLIEHERTGLLAPGNGDVEALARALRRLMADAEARRIMGQVARAAMSQYAPGKIMDRWEELFGRMVANQDARNGAGTAYRGS